MEQKIMDDILGGYGKLVRELKNLREDQVRNLINYEVSTKNRHDCVERMHMRYCKLRMRREREELKNGGLL